MPRAVGLWNNTQAFSEHQSVDHPVSLYAASKKANELMAHTYGIWLAGDGSAVSRFMDPGPA